MVFQVTNQKTGHSFSVENTETVLDAAMRQSRAFSYSCRSGSCGSCKARLISGEVDPGDCAAGALSGSSGSDGSFGMSGIAGAGAFACPNSGINSFLSINSCRSAKFAGHFCRFARQIFPGEWLPRQALPGEKRQPNQGRPH